MIEGKTIIRSDDLRAENRHRVLLTLRTEGPLSRARVGKITGLSQASLSTLLSAMTEEGIVTSKNSQLPSSARRGRPQTIVALDPLAAVAVTVALTADMLHTCLIDYAGKVIHKQNLSIETRALSESTLCNTVNKEITKALGKFQGTPCCAIAFGFEGVTDSVAGDLLWSPILTTSNIPIALSLEKKFKVPVTVQNDCRLIAKALHHSRYDELGDSFAAILFSHGIGMGMYLHGEPFSGAHSSALELGHIPFELDGALCRCGKNGCIEAYASDYGILRALNGSPALTEPALRIQQEQIKSMLNDGKKLSKQAQQVFTTAGRAIGHGMATIYTLFDPIPVALIGRSDTINDLMMDDIRATLQSSVRGTDKLDKLIHCFDDDGGLMQQGLALEATASIDRQYAYRRDLNAVKTC